MMNFIKKHLTKSIKLATLCSMVVGGVQLSYANIYDEFKKSPSAVSTITHTDRMIAVLDVNREQTARTPADIGETRLAVMMEQAAAQSVLDTARSIISYTQDTTPGVGLSRSSTCEAMIEHKTHVKRHDLSTKVRHAIAKSKAATYYQNEGNKRQLRALDHYANYCDLSEAKYGNCLPAPNAKGGMNVSYGNIANNMTLTEDQINAGYSYVNNVIDPSKTDLSKCKTAVCNALKIEEAQYHAVGSAIQNALLQQMQDSIVYDEPPGGIKTITVEQLGELSAPWDGNLVAWDEAATTERHSISLPSIGNLDEAMKALLSGIAHGEAKSADAYNNGQGCNLSRSKPSGDGMTKITAMTPVEIIRRYDSSYRLSGSVKRADVACTQRLFAVGLYQFVPETLSGLIKKHPQYANQPFTVEVQTMFAIELMRGRPRVKAFLDGRSDDINGAIHDLSQIWASIPVPAGYPRSKNATGQHISNGSDSYYGAGNSANIQSGVLVRHALEQMRRLKTSSANSNK